MAEDPKTLQMVEIQIGAFSALSVGQSTDAPLYGRRSIDRQVEEKRPTDLIRRLQFFGRPTRPSVAVLQQTDAPVGLTEGNFDVLVFFLKMEDMAGTIG